MAYTQEEINNWGTMGDPLMYSNGAFLRPRADIMAPVPQQELPTLRPKAEITDSDLEWYQRVNGASWFNAGMTIALSAIPSLIDAFTSSKIYNLYREQERLAIENAEIQAKRLERRGALALANLETKHAILQGKNELALAGAGAGAISGSALDKLVSNKKYDTREEYAQSLETLYAVDNARRDGLINAMSVAGSAASAAYDKRGKYISNLIGGIQKATDSITTDIKQTYLQEIKVAARDAEYQKLLNRAKAFYNIPQENTSLNIQSIDSSSTDSSIGKIEI